MSDDHRVALRQILTETLKAHPGLGEDKVFERFAAEQILKEHRIELDVEELRDGVIGGGGDGGIDGFFLFVNRRLIREDTDLSAYSSDTRLNIELVVIQASRQIGFSEGAVDNSQISPGTACGLPQITLRLNRGIEPRFLRRSRSFAESTATTSISVRPRHCVFTTSPRRMKYIQMRKRGEPGS